MVVKGTCPDWSCIKQLRVYHARHQPSLSFPGSTNVGHEPSQGGPRCRELQVFAEAKPSIQLHSQVLNAVFPLDFMFPENDPRILEGSPIRDQQCTNQIMYLIRACQCPDFSFYTGKNIFCLRRPISGTRRGVGPTVHANRRIALSFH